MVNAKAVKVPEARQIAIRQSGSDRAITVVFYTVLALYSVLCLFPLVLAFSVAFSDEATVARNGYALWPQNFTLNTFRFIISQRVTIMLIAYKNSIITTVVGTVCASFVTVAYAYVLTVPTFRSRNILAFFSYFTMLFSGGMLPWYILCTKYYGLANTYQGLILPYMMNVFNMYLMRNYFKTIPAEIFESARIDGAGHITIFFRIMLPLAQVGVVTIALFYGLAYWNDFYLPLMFSTKENYQTLQFMLYRLMSQINFLATGSDSASGIGHIQPPVETARMAMTVIAIGPIILLYPFIQKYFVKGIIVGAVKG